MVKNRFSKEVKRIVKEFNLKGVEELSRIEYDKILKLVNEKFIQRSDNFGLWEDIQDKYSIRDKDSWLWIPDFVKDQSFILFFEPNSEKSAFSFLDVKDFIEILSESFYYTFYLTNENCDFLLTQNDHDYLIASGSAKKWLKDYVNKVPKDSK